MNKSKYHRNTQHVFKFGHILYILHYTVHYKASVTKGPFHGFQRP